MADKLVFARDHLPWAPPALLLEPRGHKDLYGAILTEPCSLEADLGVIFMSNQDYEPMCGHGLIGVVTSVLECGILSPSEPETSLVVETAVGLIGVRAWVEAGRVQRVAFDNVPSFALMLDAELVMPDGGTLKVDVAFGGNFFVLVEASQLDLDLTPACLDRLVEVGMAILTAANQQFTVAHPDIPEARQITDVRFLAPPLSPAAHSRNVVVLGDRMVDRSPCGTGTCAELAVRYARGLLQVGQPFITESILGTQFIGSVVREVVKGSGGKSDPARIYPARNYPARNYPAIIPRVEGSAYITGINQLVFSESDPFQRGFLLASA